LGVIIAEGDASLTPEDLIRLADEKLYQAKLAGRNCVKM
jgi:PleD family two-component response regulator